MDGMIWSELGAAYPLAGGSYNFLKEAYGKKWGRLMSFLFVWQTCLPSPAGRRLRRHREFAASISITCSRSARSARKALVSGAIVILVVALLYRNIRTIGKISVFLWGGVIVTILWIIISGFSHRQVHYTFMPSGDQSLFSFSFVLPRA